jgi:zinc/manganese transport system permease protein
VLSGLIAPGFFSNGPVRGALVVGGMVALVSGVVGTFTVLRRQSFSGHALGDVGATGGAAAFLTGLNPRGGVVGIAIVAAGTIELIGVRRPRARDVAAGLVLGAGLGLAALFLFLGSTTSTSGSSSSILFGSLFVLSASMLPSIIALAAGALALVVGCFRMLLLTAVHPDLAAARGVRVRLVGAVYLLALALAVSLAAETIGAVLATALLVGPAATALRLTRRPGRAALVAGAVGIAATWLGILLAYDSYTWPPAGHTWPVSFFIVALVLTFYLLAQLPLERWLRPGGPRR